MNGTWIEPEVNWQPIDYLNADDLNRIENNIGYLYEELNKLPYNIPTQIHKTWNNKGIPNTSDIERICNNIKKIAEYYYAPPKYELLSVITSKISLNNRDISFLEECLKWIYNEFTILKRNYNSHQVLKQKQFTHAQLINYRHEQIRKDWSLLVYQHN